MSDRSTFFALIALLTFILMSAPAFAKEFKSSDDFVSQAAMNNLFEIETSKLALQRTRNPAVRQFAQNMIDDHTLASGKLRNAVDSSKLNGNLITNSLDAKHQQHYTDLVNASDDDFDKAYVDIQNDAHAQAVALLTAYSKDGDSTALKQFAAETLPTLKNHAKHSDRLADQID